MAEGKVRIELLEVHFDVVGNGEQEFAKLFEQYINRWSRLQNERHARERDFEAERMASDRGFGG